MYIGVNDQAKKVSNAYIGINGQAKQISKIYIGDINNKAKLAWQNFSGEIIDINDEKYNDLNFKNLNSLIFNKNLENEVVYTIPETGIYKIELISPFTQSFLSKYYRNSNMLFGGKIQINNTEYSLQNYGSRIFTLTPKDCLNNYLTLSLAEPLKALKLGRGSSYGAQYMNLAKGQKIKMEWINTNNIHTEPSYLIVNIDNNEKLKLEFEGGDSLNKHNFLNCVEDSLDYSYWQDNNMDGLFNTFNLDYYYGNDNNIKLQTDGYKFINVDNTLKNFDIINSDERSYTIISQDQSVMNSDTCNQLGLGAPQEMSAIGNYAMYLTLTFSENYDKVQISIGNDNSIVDAYHGCFRITPASIKTEE